MELGDNLFRRGRYREAHAQFELALSLAHMHVNRMLRSAQRAQELVIYEMLGRAYRSQAARRSR